jgi:rhomboid protease GluP
VIVVVDILIFSFMLIFGSSKRSGYYLLCISEETILNFGALSPIMMKYELEFWRLITFTFVHSSLNHLVLEGFVKYIFFTYFEGVVGWRNTAVMYFLNSFTGGLFTSLLFDDLVYGGLVPLMGFLGCHLAIIVLIMLRHPEHTQPIRNITVILLLGLTVFIMLADLNASVGAVGAIACGWSVAFGIVRMPDEGNNLCLKILRVFSFLIITMFIHFGLLIFFTTRTPGPSIIFDFGNPFMGSKSVDTRMKV